MDTFPSLNFQSQVRSKNHTGLQILRSLIFFRVLSPFQSPQFSVFHNRKTKTPMEKVDAGKFLRALSVSGACIYVPIYAGKSNVSWEAQLRSPGGALPRCATLRSARVCSLARPPHQPNFCSHGVILPKSNRGMFVFSLSKR